MADLSETSETSSTSEASAGQSEPAAQSEDAAHGQPTIDVEALAEKVYRLMLAEIRLDRARGLASSDGG